MPRVKTSTVFEAIARTFYVLEHPLRTSPPASGQLGRQRRSEPTRKWIGNQLLWLGEILHKELGQRQREGGTVRRQTFGSNELAQPDLAGALMAIGQHVFRDLACRRIGECTRLEAVGAIAVTGGALLTALGDQLEVSFTVMRYVV